MNILLIILYVNLNTKFITNQILTKQVCYKIENKKEKSDNETVKYIDKIINELEELTEKESYTQEDQERIKNDLLKLKNFILKKGKINGKSWSDLSNQDKKKIYKCIINIDQKIESKFPNYKSKLKIFSKNEYNRIKEQAKEEINQYIKAAGNDKIAEQKTGIKKIISNIKNKIKKWLSK